jgi:hypothetical protein
MAALTQNITLPLPIVFVCLVLLSQCYKQSVNPFVIFFGHIKALTQRLMPEFVKLNMTCKYFNEQEYHG